MPEPEGPEDERFVCVVTAAGVEALRESAAAFDSEREAPLAAELIAIDAVLGRHDLLTDDLGLKARWPCIILLMGPTVVAEVNQVGSCDHSTRRALFLGLVVSLAVTGCSRDSGTSGPASEPVGDVLLQFASTSGEPSAADLLDIDFLEEGNTIDARHGIPQDSSVRLEDVPTRTDEVHVLAREGGRVVAESYRAVSVPEGETATVEVAMVARSCRAPGTVAKETINMLNLVTVIAGGDNAISDEDWPTYEPSPPFSKNSDRHLLFVDSCFYRSFSDSWDCSGEDCFTYVPHDGYTWLRLARTEHLETIPASDNTDRVPPPGYVQIVVFEKCQELVFEGQIWEMHDPYGNVYVMHANPDGVPDTVTPTLPESWRIETRTLDKPLVLDPRGKSCRYTLIKDDQDQAYHQYVFDGLEGLSTVVSPECAALLDEN